jgi:hypothetical protein
VDGLAFVESAKSQKTVRCVIPAEVDYSGFDFLKVRILSLTALGHSWR